jgi:hypothetical protein
MRKTSLSSFSSYPQNKKKPFKPIPSPPQRHPLNRYPISKLSHRNMPPLYISKPQSLSIHENQAKLSKIFYSANQDQRQLTFKLLSSRENEIDAIIENNDSFTDRYSPTKHKFSHKLIGELQLPRKFFNINPSEKYFSSTSSIFPSKPLKFPELLKKTVTSARVEHERLKEIRRKGMTSLNHYKKLRIDPSIAPRLKEFLPGVPFGHGKSEEFLAACKEGNMEKVMSFLEMNKWLAHVFDGSGQTGLHWAVKRKQGMVARALIIAGIWVDVCDFVRFI